MAVSNIDNSMIGIGSNPSLIFPAADYVSDEAQIINKSKYLNNRGVRGTYVGQKLMETQWIGEGILNNIVLPVIFMYDGGSGTPIRTWTDELKITIHKRDPDTKVILKTEDAKSIFSSDISYNVGSMPYDPRDNKTGNQYYFFDKAYEYKFVVTVNKLTTGAWIEIDALYLQYAQRIGVQAARQVAYTDSSGYYPNEQVPVIEGMLFTITSTAGTDGSCYFEIVLPAEVYKNDGNLTTVGGSTISGSGFSMVYQNGIRTPFYRIDSIACNYQGGFFAYSGGPIISTDTVATDYGLGVTVRGFGLKASTQYWVWVTIYGYQDPIAV